MKLRNLCALCVFAVLFLSRGLDAQIRSASDTLTPLRLVQKYVSPNGFPEKLKYFCCEVYQEWYADSTLGQKLPPRVQRDCRLIYQDSVHATVSVWLHDSLTSRDIYFYLVKRQNWTVYALRALAMTSLAHAEIKKLDSLPPDQRGDVYTKKSGHPYAFDYANLKLWTSNDTQLVSYFYANKNKFVKLQAQLKKQGYYGKSDSLLVKAIFNKKIRKAADELLIRNFEFDKKYPGCVFYLLGGMTDNTVGYFYQPDPAKVPKMTEKKFILVRPLGDGWYLFKTT